MVKCDVLVIGAGIVGLSTAYHLKISDPKLNIIIVEKKPSPGQGETGKAPGGFRLDVWTSKTNFVLSRSSIMFYKYIQESLKIDLGMKWIGYLFMMDNRLYEAAKPALRKMDSMGVKYKIYSKEELAKNLNVNVNVEDEEAKSMNLRNIDVGLMFPNAGYWRQENMVKFYEMEFIKMGGKILYNTFTSRIITGPRVEFSIPGEPHIWQEVTIKGALTDKGIIEANEVVVAASAWAPQILDLIGIDCHFKPKKRQVFIVKASNELLKQVMFARGFNELNAAPFLFIHVRGESWLWMKPDIGELAYWMGCSDHLGRAYGVVEDDPPAEENFYKYGIYQVLVKYFPQFINIYPSNSHAGYYDISIDGLPVVHRESNITVVGGTSGNGLSKADALGRITAAACLNREYAELYNGEKFRVSDLSITNRNIDKEIFII